MEESESGAVLSSVPFVTLGKRMGWGAMKRGTGRTSALLSITVQQGRDSVVGCGPGGGVE